MSTKNVPIILNVPKTVSATLNDKCWAILYVDFIRTTQRHRCIRKLYILTKNGFEMEMEFCPCRRYRDLLLKYRRTYQFARRHIHQLTYTPWGISLPCRQAVPKLNEFIVNNGIDLILFQGGATEAEMCKELDIASINIETMNIKKVYSSPREDMNFYYNQLSTK